MTQTSLSPVVRHIRKLVGADAVRELSDTELLERFIADREERAFAALLRRHGPLVWSVCWQVLHHRQDAEDAFQATFLLLARQAASIRRTEAVPSWLYRVAYRVATKARVNMARQRFQERQVERGSRLSQPCHTVSPPEAEAAWRELQAVLNEELERLPEKYRAPFLMCCLDGKTGPEAARQLGWKLGTLTSRLTEARRLLQRRLARRGVMLSAVLAAATVARQGAAVASVALAEGTVKAALAFTGHATTAGLVSANAVALVEGMAPKLLVTKLKVATALLLAATVATGTGIATHQALAEKAAAPPSAAPKEVPKAVFAANDKAKPAETKQETKGSVVFGGRVLDPDGKPFAGAKLYLLNHASQGMRKKVLATSTSEGRFGFNVAEADVTLPAAIVDDPWNHVFVMAMAEGYGPAFKTVGKRQAAGDLTLQLAKDDVPIVGRILDLQGKPVAGVTVRVRGLYQAKQGDLAPFVEGLRTRKEGYAVHNDLLRGWYDLGNLYPTLTSDADGRFRLKNVGRERMVMLRIEGPSIETREVNVLTRPCETITVPEWKRNPEGGRLTYYGSTFNHAAPPSKPIVGVVRDKDTGKPIRGAIVQSYMIAGSNVSGRTDLTTVADMDGRYRLTGMPKGLGNQVRALSPDDQPYLAAVKNAADTPGLEPVTVDFALKRGLWITGRVTDKVTGKPVRAQIEYFLFADNPHVKEAPGLSTNRLENRDDGTFRLIGLPGRSLVVARAWGDRHLVGVGAENIKGRLQDGFLDTQPGLCHPTHFHTLVELNPDKQANAVVCNVLLDPGRTLTGAVLGRDGKPLAGVRVSGLKSYAYTYWDHEPLKTAEFKVFALKPSQPRRLLFLHEGKRLAGTVMVRGDEKDPPRVKLEPWGMLTGRIVNADGQPQSNVEIMSVGIPSGDSDFATLHTRSIHPDKDGKFRIEGLVPGLKYRIGIMAAGFRLAGYLSDGVLTIKSGENKDLGDVQAKPIE